MITSKASLSNNPDGRDPHITDASIVIFTPTLSLAGLYILLY